MNKLEYLDRLETLLLRARLPKSEIDDILRDYAEYFEEGHRQGQSDSEISAKLGSPETVARQLIEDNEEEQRRRKEESRRQAQEAVAQRKEQLRQKMQQTGEDVGRAWKKSKESIKEALTLEEAGAAPRRGGLWAGLGRMLGRMGHGILWCMGLGLGIIGLGGLMCFCVGLAMGLLGVWFTAAVVIVSGVGLMILTGLMMSLLSSLAAGGVAFFSGLSVGALGVLGCCLAWKLTQLYARLLFLMKEAVVWVGRRLFDRAPERHRRPDSQKEQGGDLTKEWPQLADTSEEKEGMSDETQW